jgi:hypothetical protein
MTHTPKYYTQKQLGPAGPPDLNKRSIHRYSDHKKIAEFAPSNPKDGWTNTDEEAVEAYLSIITAHLESKDAADYGR